MHFPFIVSLNIDSSGSRLWPDNRSLFVDLRLLYHNARFINRLAVDNIKPLKTFTLRHFWEDNTGSGVPQEPWLNYRNGPFVSTRPYFFNLNLFLDIINAKDERVTGAGFFAQQPLGQRV